MTAHNLSADGSHHNGGAEFFGYGYRDPAEPRLQLIRIYHRRGEHRGQHEDRYFVDGERVADYAAAVEALKTPAVLTPEERPFLALFTDTPAPRPSGDVEIIFRLREKGFVKAERRLWSLTDAGLAKIAQELAHG